MAFMKKYPHLETITQKFSESGHSMIQEVDNAHSAIERHLRCCETFSPISLVRQLLSVRRNPKLTIIQMKANNYLSFEDSKHLNFNKVPYSTVKQLKYEKGKLNFVSFKTCHNKDYPLSCVNILKEQRKSRGISKTSDSVPLTVQSLCNLKEIKSDIPLSKEKIQDLKAMYTYMPAIDVQFYESIIKDNETPKKRKTI